jgi:uncharacterized protein YfiM (DUF2279 family)
LQARDLAVALEPTAAFNGGKLEKDLAPMIARPTVALAVLALWLGPVAADEPKAFACTFTAGVTHAYDKGQFTAEKASPLSFGILAIDHMGQSADLRMQGGAGALRVVQAVNATHFLEVATEGFLNITTIYDKDESRGGAYPAVHSRHFAIVGQPIVTQYQGFCEAKG